MRFLSLLLLVVSCDQGSKAPPASTPANPPRDAMSTPDATAPSADPVMPQVEKVLVRLCNDTKHDVTDLSYHDISVGRLAKGACSPYELATTSYSYTNVHFNIGKDTFDINPIDYMGETPLSMGHWSYHLTITDYAHRAADVRAKKEPN